MQSLTAIDQPTAYADLGPTRRLISSVPPAESRQPKKPPAAIMRLIAELGLRYRPSAQADLEAHAEAIGLLTCDVADIPPHLLEQAITEWVRSNRWMPKACELIDLAKAMLPSVRPRHDETGGSFLENLCARYNRDNKRTDMEWVIDGDWIKFQRCNQQ